MFGYKLVSFVFLTLCLTASCKNAFYKAKVHIHNQHIPEITQLMVKDYVYCTELRIEECNVSKIQNEAFSNSIFMLKLSLKENKLQEISASMFQFSETPLIEELDLSDNQIQTIDQSAFTKMKSLKNITLANNKLRLYHSEWFVNTPSLKYIDISNNFITYLQNIRHDPRIDNFTLIASHNLLTHIESQAFSNIASFSKLWLDDNFLNDIPTISNYYNRYQYSKKIIVKEIRLDNNYIICLSGQLAGVEKYNISSNRWNNSCKEDFIKNVKV